MALLFVDSYDHYETVDLSKKYSTIIESPSISNNGRCGSNSLLIDGDEGVIKGVNPTSRTEAIWGFAVKFTVDAGGQGHFTTLMGGSNPVMVFRRTSTGGLEYSINSAAAFSTYTPLTAGDLLRIGQWYYIEFKVVVATSAAGSIAVRINSQDRTLSGFSSGVTTAFYADYWDGIKLWSPLFGRPIYIDDFYISDTSGASPWNNFLGDVRVEYLQPTANGATQQWDNTGGAAAWNSVDDGSAPDEDTSYISTATVTEEATFVYEDAALPSGATVFGVQMSFLAKKDEPGDRVIKAIVREGGTNYEGGIDLFPSDDNYDYRHTIMQVNPADSAAWAITDINADEFGARLDV